MGGYGAEQPVRLTVDPVSKVKNIGAAVVAADPELDRPKAAGGWPPVSIGIVPCNLPLLGMKALISLC